MRTQYYISDARHIKVVCFSGKDTVVAKASFSLNTDRLPESIELTNVSMNTFAFRMWCRNLFVADFTALYAKAKGFYEDSDELEFNFM